MGAEGIVSKASTSQLDCKQVVSRESRRGSGTCAKSKLQNGLGILQRGKAVDNRRVFLMLAAFSTLLIGLCQGLVCAFADRLQFQMTGEDFCGGQTPGICLERSWGLGSRMAAWDPPRRCEYRQDPVRGQRQAAGPGARDICLAKTVSSAWERYLLKRVFSV